MQVVVGRIGRAHGVRGEVAVDIRTDKPDVRFASGSELVVEAVGARSDVLPKQLTVVRARSHRGRLVVAFEGINDRDAADQLRGALLTVEVDDTAAEDEDDEYYDWQLVGLRVLNRGEDIGRVVAVRHSPAQDLLVVARSDGDEVMIPFVDAMVTSVDLVTQTISADLPEGLLDLAKES